MSITAFNSFKVSLKRVCFLTCSEGMVDSTVLAVSSNDFCLFSYVLLILLHD